MKKKKPIKKVTDNDQKLIDAINSGDKNIFLDLVQKYEGKLYNFGLKICKDVSDAEDLVQDTFINVFKYVKDFRQETRFKNWMYRIAANVCWKMKRKSKYAPEKVLSLEEFIPEDHTKVDTKIPQWASLPVDQLLDNELSEHINQAVQKLPTRYKLILVLRDMEGFSTEETAEILEITKTNVKTRLHRARLFLREELKDYYENK